MRALGIPLVAIVLVSAALVGVVVGEPHEPVPIEPDARRRDDAQVATFALG